MLGMGGKNPKRKNSLPSPFYDMEANCFPVSENAENKPDLPYVGGGFDLMEKKTGSGTVRTGRMNLL